MHSETRVVALVVAAIFITPSHAGSEQTRAEPVKTTQNAGQSQVPSAVVSASKPPEAAPINTLPAKQATTTTRKPTALHAAPKSAMTDLPTSNRLAISIFAGVFTLIVALWIGARRD